MGITNATECHALSPLMNRDLSGLPVLPRGSGYPRQAFLAGLSGSVQGLPKLRIERLED
jgi:hypothetical protein